MSLIFFFKKKRKTFKDLFPKTEIKKNGTAVLSGKYGASSNSSDDYLNNVISGVIDFNGSSDYIEMFSNTSSGITRVLSGDSQRTFFGAYKLIGA